jgi:hypothetical protein
LKLLTGKIVAVDIREPTADLMLQFENGVSFESFNSSGGYEGWQYSCADGFTLIAMGGGGLATVKEDGSS